jgi:Tfp pilus assembly protein PilO
VNEKKILLGIGAGTLVVTAAMGYGIYETWNAITETQTQAEAKKVEIAEAKKKVDEIRKLEDRAIVLRESVAALASVLPTDKEVEEFVFR